MKNKIEKMGLVGNFQYMKGYFRKEKSIYLFIYLLFYFYIYLN